MQGAKLFLWESYAKSEAKGRKRKTLLHCHTFRVLLMRSMCQEPRKSEATHRRDEQRPRRHQREQASLVFPWAEPTEWASHSQYTSPVIHTFFSVHGRELTFRGLANFPIRQQKIPTARNLADGTVSCLSGPLDMAECRGSRVCVGRTNTHPIKPRSPNAMRARRCKKSGDSYRR